MVQKQDLISYVAMMAALDAKTVTVHYRYLYEAGHLSKVTGRGRSARNVTIEDAWSLLLSVAISPSPKIGAEFMPVFSKMETTYLHQTLSAEDLPTIRREIRGWERLDAVMIPIMKDCGSGELNRLPGLLSLNTTDFEALLIIDNNRSFFTCEDEEIPPAARPFSKWHRKTEIPLPSLLDLAQFVAGEV